MTKPARFDLSTFKQEQDRVPHGGARCNVFLFESKLTDEEIRSFRQALADQSIPLTAIYRTVKKIGFVGGTGSLYEHRRGEGCATCDKLARKL